MNKANDGTWLILTNNGQRVVLLPTREDETAYYGHSVAMHPVVGDYGYVGIESHEEECYLKQEWTLQEAHHA